MSDTQQQQQQQDELRSTIQALKSLQRAHEPQTLLVPICGGVAFARGKLADREDCVLAHLGDGSWFHRCSPHEATAIQSRRLNPQPPPPTALPPAPPAATPPLPAAAAAATSSSSSSSSAAAAAAAAVQVTEPVQDSPLAMFEIEEYLDENGREISSRMIDVRSKIDQTEPLRQSLVTKMQGNQDSSSSSSSLSSAADIKTQVPMRDLFMEDLARDDAKQHALEDAQLDTKLSYDEMMAKLSELAVQEAKIEADATANAASSVDLKSSEWKTGFLSKNTAAASKSPSTPSPSPPPRSTAAPTTSTTPTASPPPPPRSTAAPTPPPASMKPTTSNPFSGRIVERQPASQLPSSSSTAPAGTAASERITLSAAVSEAPLQLHSLQPSQNGAPPQKNVQVQG